MPPGPKPPRPQPKGPKPTIEDLMSKGLPLNLATSVAKGQMTEDEALKRLVLQAEVDRLMRKHNIGRPIAMQIALGQANLDSFLAKRRMTEHREANHMRSCLDDAVQHKKPMTLLVHGKGRVEGRVISSESYQVVVQVAGGEHQTIHKLQIKAAWIAEERRLVSPMMQRSNPELSKNPRAPIPRPQDRYPCSDRTLFAFLDEKKTVAATLLEGEIATGQIYWFGRYEIGMGPKPRKDGKGEPHLTVFRHALHDLREA